MDEEQKRRIIKSAWLCEEVPEVPFLIEVGKAHRATPEFLRDPRKDLECQEEYCRDMGRTGSYFLPSIKPNLGIGYIAASFGCPWTANDEECDPWIQPIIREDNADAVYDLGLPDPAKSGMNTLAFERINYFQEHSRHPLRLVNVPSPLVAASQIWEYQSFITGMLINPKAVHALLEKVTKAIIESVRLQLKIINRIFSLTHEPWYQPPEVGLRVSDDTAAVLSPDTYLEFGVPYNNQLAEVFGGLVVHSCGDITHILPGMLKIKGLRGIDFVPQQNDLDRVVKIIGGRTALLLRYYLREFDDPTKIDLLEYSRLLIQKFGRRGVMLMTQVDDFAAARDLDKELHGLLRS